MKAYRGKEKGGWRGQVDRPEKGREGKGGSAVAAEMDADWIAAEVKGGGEGVRVQTPPTCSCLACSTET